MSHRDTLRALLRADEAEVPHAYQDSQGYWTIGVGRLIDKRRGGGLRPDEIALMLENDITAAEEDCRILFPRFDSLSDARKVVLCSMAFNLGRGGLAAFKRLRKAIDAADYETASAEMLHSSWALQVGRRAERLAKQMREG
jgi:lysozyme